MSETDFILIGLINFSHFSTLQYPIFTMKTSSWSISSGPKERVRFSCLNIFWKVSPSFLAPFPSHVTLEVNSFLDKKFPLFLNYSNRLKSIKFKKELLTEESFYFFFSCFLRIIPFYSDFQTVWFSCGCQTTPAPY